MQSQSVVVSAQSCTVHWVSSDKKLGLALPCRTRPRRKASPPNRLSFGPSCVVLHRPAIQSPQERQGKKRQRKKTKQTARACKIATFVTELPTGTASTDGSSFASLAQRGPTLRSLSKLSKLSLHLPTFFFLVLKITHVSAWRRSAARSTFPARPPKSNDSPQSTGKVCDCVPCLCRRHLHHEDPLRKPRGSGSGQQRPKLWSLCSFRNC